MTMDCEQETFVSRRSIFTAAAAALAGTAFAAVPLTLAQAAESEGDALLIDAWTKYQAAMSHNTDLSNQIEPLVKEAYALLPASIGREEFLSLTLEGQIAYNRQRDRYWEEAFDQTGLTAAQKEQDHFLETVVEPLALIICNTAPTTLKGVGIKAAYLLDYACPQVLCAGKHDTLGDEALCEFIEQLAGLSPGEA